jgi:hypothetical protein
LKNTFKKKHKYNTIEMEIEMEMEMEIEMEIEREIEMERAWMFGFN